MSTLRNITTIAIAASLIICAMTVAIAADAKAAMQFGTVDIEKAYAGYQKSAQIKDELKAAYDKANLKLDLMKANKLLTSEEIAELVELSTKDKQTEADKARINTLLDASKKRDQEMQMLEQKQDASDAEKARLQQLIEQRKNSEEAYKKSFETLQKELTNKENELLSAAKKDIVDAVATVAKEKGISIVFNRSIGLADFIIYSAVDITDDVIKKLNKK
ncbi:MAG: OmpH family outer membrane protein [Armatimonadetes bacterium]|nr:OmpH family outer membrane protein [Armatimonadota bacterium]